MKAYSYSTADRGQKLVITGPSQHVFVQSKETGQSAVNNQ